MGSFVLGTAQLGLDYGINNKTGLPSRSQAIAILETSQQLGIQELDTAEAYGAAHAIIEEFHRDHAPFSLMTKVILGDIQGSLEEHVLRMRDRLRVESISALYFHRFEDFAGLPSLKPIEKLKERKTIFRFGVSVYSNDQALRALEHDSVDLIQLPYNLLDNRRKRSEVFERARAFGKEVYVRSAFLQGALLMSPAELPGRLAPLAPYLDRIRAICRSSGVSVQELALAYAARSGANGVVIGIDTPDQLRANVLAFQRGLSADFPAEAMAQIDETDVREELLLNPALWK